MILIEAIKNSFKKILNNPAIQLFLILFLIVIQLLASYAYVAQSKIIYIMLRLCMFAVVCVFISGWVNVIKEALDEKKEKRPYGAFLEGIGKNILTSSICTILYCIVLSAVFYIAQIIAIKMFGNVDFLFKDLQTLNPDNASIMEYYSNLSIEKRKILFGWEMCSLGAIAVLNFLFLFYLPIVFCNVEKNKFLHPIICILKSIIFSIKNFFTTVAILILAYFGTMILAVLNALFIQNPILSLLFLLAIIYLCAFIVVLLFDYYIKKNEKETNCSNGPDSFGQDSSCNSIGKKD